MDQKTKADLCEAIQHHLETVGPLDWAPVVDRFKSTVSERTIWRWISRVKQGAAPTATLQRVKKKVKTKPAAKAETKKHLPAAPSPDYLAKNGEAGRASLDFITQLHEQLERCAKLEQRAMTADGEKIANAKLYGNVIRLRKELMDQALKAMDRVWNYRRIEEFHEIIMDEIAAADADTAHRIIARLAELNSRYGITLEGAL